MAWVWSTRTSGYKLSVVVVFVAYVLYVLGYAVPFWFVHEAGQAYSGLWLACFQLNKQSDGSAQCVKIVADGSAGWFKAVQALESVGLMVLTGACVYAAVVNFHAQGKPLFHKRFLEIITALGGLFGFIACMVLVAKTRIPLRPTLDWAFTVNLTGCLLAMAISVIISIIKHTEPADTPTPAGVIAYPSHGPVQMVMPPQGQSYPPPAFAGGIQMAGVAASPQTAAAPNLTV